MADLRKNDEAIAFFAANGHPTAYNDGMLHWLRHYYFEPFSTLPDLLARYIKENGYTMVAAFSPADLFASSEAGAWYDLTDITTLFQDSAGTTPVTTTGQPVGRVEDKSGNGHHLVQTTDSKRPLYGTDEAGLKCLSFDGISQNLENGTLDLTGTQAISWFSAHETAEETSGSVVTHVTQFTNTGSLELLSHSGANDTILFGGRSTTGSTNWAGQAADFTPPYRLVVAGNIDYAEAAGSEWQTRWNGVAIGQTHGGTQENTGTFGTGTLYLGSRTGAAVFFTGNFFSLVIRGVASSAAEVNNGESYMNLLSRSF